MPRRRVLDLLAVLIVLACLGQVVFHRFVLYDDDAHVRRNPLYRPVTVRNLAGFWRRPYQGMYIPLTYTVWGGIAAAHNSAELRPLPFHAANLVVHVLAVLVVASTLRVVLRNDWAAFAGALLFGLHPLQVEPVAWVSGFRDVLSGFLVLVAVWQYACRATAGNRTRASAHYALATLAFAAAILSKPSAAAAPLVAGVLACAMLRRRVGRTALELLPWVAIALPVMLVTRAAQAAYAPIAGPPLWQRPLVAGDALTFYLSKLILPLGLGPDYGRTPGFVLAHGWAYWTAALPLLLAGVLAWKLRWRWAVAAGGVFLAALVPVLGLVPFSFQNTSTVADRYAYVALLGPAIALAYLVHRRRAWRVVAVVLACFGVVSIVQARHWSDSLALFEHALSVNPRSAMARVGLGLLAESVGETDAAVTFYRRAIEVDPAFTQARLRLGGIFERRNALAEAAEQYQAAVRSDPTLARAYFRLGIVLQRQGELDEAFAQFSKAASLDPPWKHAAWTRMASVREAQGRTAEAAELYRKALAVKPDFEPARRGLKRVRQRMDRK